MMVERYYEYLGMSYEQASREGERLVKLAAKTGNWFSIIGRLAALREIMARHHDSLCEAMVNIQMGTFNEAPCRGAGLG